MRTLLMLNNYFHDMAVAMVAVGGFTTFLLIRMAQKRDTDTMLMVLTIYPKMAAFMMWTTSFVLVAGFVRVWNFRMFELGNAVKNDQVLALTIKHIILFIFFAYGIYLWIIVHKKVKAMRKELQNQH